MTKPQDVGFEPDILETVFENGKLLKTFTLDQVRENTKKSLKYWR